MASKTSSNKLVKIEKQPMVPEGSDPMTIEQMEAITFSKFSESADLGLTQEQINTLKKPCPTDRMTIRPCRAHTDNPNPLCENCIISKEWSWVAEIYDEAFGEGKWHLTPAPWNIKFFQTGNVVYREYVLWVKCGDVSKFADTAIGGHEEHRKTANFADAAESTWSDALKRTHKHILENRLLRNKRGVAQVRKQFEPPQMPMKGAVATQSEKPKSDLPDVIQKMLDAFGDLGITTEQIEERLGHPIKSTTEQEIGMLKNIFVAIKNKRATWETYAVRK